MRLAFALVLAALALLGTSAPGEAQIAPETSGKPAAAASPAASVKAGSQRRIERRTPPRRHAPRR